MERKKPLDIKSLMSPPEPTLHDTFGRTPSSETMSAKSMPLFPRVLPMSPPVSPAAKSIDPENAATNGVRDPILYSDSQSPPSSQSPLFTDNETLATQRVVDGHIAARDENLFRQVSPPRKAEYELALGFQFQVMKGFTANPRQWYKRERAQLLEDRALQNGGRRYTNIAPASGLNATRPPRTYTQASKNGVVKQPRPKPLPAVKAPVDPNKVKAIREDKDYNSIPDLCPPLDSLPKKHNSLKVEWRGAPINLDDDPDAHLLHEDERLLAANLRLDCATYLTSKRRIFVSRLECLKRGKEFRKTDSQQACKIDVNKASKLWQAFEKVGWLNPHWMDKYL
ncbi:Homeodomain-like protein [Bisporella sp. PMI_857]|nr:Homeodomain-like protein [Bisporella sp. PMI_857]